MNSDEQDCRWTFLGFESPSGEKPVQSWFYSLPEEHRDEIKDVLAFLQVTPRAYWEEQPNRLFDPLIGEGGISEIRFEPIKCIRGKFYYRIYGFFGAEEEKSYKFLHATNKKVRNDRPGKKIGKRRLLEVQENTATLHKFSLDKEIPYGEIKEGA